MPDSCAFFHDVPSHSAHLWPPADTVASKYAQYSLFGARAALWEMDLFVVGGGFPCKFPLPLLLSNPALATKLQ